MANKEFLICVLQYLILEAQSLEPQEPEWPWPIPEPEEGAGSRNGSGFFANERSGLRMCGYQVGAKGMSAQERKRFLDHFFRNSLPSVVRLHFGDEYGTPGSEKRLRKMANVLASNCRNFKRNDRVKFRLAIAHWESDLDYLKRSYYRAGMFPWPPVED